MKKYKIIGLFWSITSYGRQIKNYDNLNDHLNKGWAIERVDMLGSDCIIYIISKESEEDNK